MPPPPAALGGPGQFGGAPSPAGYGAAAVPGGYGGPPAAVAHGAAPAPAAYGVAPPPVPYGSPPAQVGYGAAPALSPGNFGGPPQAPGMVAPPPMIGRPGGPPGMNLAAPPPPMLVSPGQLSGPPPVQPPMAGYDARYAPQAPVPASLMQPRTAPSGRLLVGFLVTFQDNPAGAFWPLYTGRIQIGRSNGDDVDIAVDDGGASGRHASIHGDAASGQVSVEDDGSKNGTYLNEERIAPGDRRRLYDSDRIRIGGTTLVVKVLVG